MSFPKNSQVISSVTKTSPEKKNTVQWAGSLWKLRLKKSLDFDDDELVAWLGRASGTTWFYFWEKKQP